MTNEEAVRRIRDHMQHHGIGQYPHLKLSEALEMAISALDNQPTSEPMTLDQLWEMDGRAAYLPQANCWVLVTKNPFVPLFTFPDGDQCNAVEWYEEVGPAYACPPAHIDREVWTAEWVKHDGYTECSKCEHWYDSTENEDEGDQPAFCPSCGRAMTPEAWAELEKRISRKEEQ